MGNFQSIPSRIERRRANRLSKSFSNKACLSPIDTRSPLSNSQTNSLPASPLASTWEDPWNECPATASVDGHFSQSLPARRPQGRPPIPRAFWSAQGDSIAEENYHFGGSAYDLSSSIPTIPVIERPSSLQPFRRASYHPDTTYYGSALSTPAPRQHLRSYSLQSNPQNTTDTIYENELEDVTSSNTYFMVDNQRFSITRRRSLLTRPGMATRRSSKQSVRRVSPPTVGHEMRSSNRTFEKSKSMQLPLPDFESYDDVDCSRPSPFIRPGTPSNDFQYTQLGALKLGSLRVVNRSASPSPSDKSNVPRESSEDLRPTRPAILDCPEGSMSSVPAPQCPPDQAPKMTTDSTSGEQSKNLPKLSPTPGSKEQTDDPISPFSFQKSPTVSTLPHYASLSAENIERVIGEISAGSNSTREKNVAQSLSKTDSGYSSATSTHSSRKNTGTSIDSQQLDCQSWDSCKTSSAGDEKKDVHRSSQANTQASPQRHLSLQDSKSSECTPHVDDDSRRWSAVDPSRSFSLKSPVGLRRTASSFRPCALWDERDFEVPNDDIRVSHPSANNIGVRPSSLNALHQKSVSTPNPVERKLSYSMRTPPPQTQNRFDASKPGYDSFAYRRLQRQNRSIAETNARQRMSIDISTEKFLLSKDELSIAAWLEQPSVRG